MEGACKEALNTINRKSDEFTTKQDRLNMKSLLLRNMRSDCLPFIITLDY